MKNYVRTITTTLTFVFIFLFSTSVLTAQYQKPAPPAQAPHDFSDKFYVNQGIDPTLLVGRRNGLDGLSVIDKMVSSSYTNVRVLVTVPAYNGTGELMYWYPLGELYEKGFMDTKLGYEAKQIASL